MQGTGPGSDAQVENGACPITDFREGSWYRYAANCDGSLILEGPTPKEIALPNTNVGEAAQGSFSIRNPDTRNRVINYQLGLSSADPSIATFTWVPPVGDGTLAAGVTLPLTVKATCVNPGSTTGTATVSAGPAGGGTVTFKITCLGAKFGPAPAPLDLTAAVGKSDSKTFALTNIGNQSLYYESPVSLSTPASPVAQVSSTSGDGVIAKGASQTFKITALCDREGSETRTLTVYRLAAKGGNRAQVGGQDDKVEVTVNVTCTPAQPKLVGPTPASLVLTALVGKSVAAKFTLGNDSKASAELTYTLTPDAPAGAVSNLTVSPASGSLVVGKSVAATVTAQCLREGVESRTVTITSNGGNASVAVTVRCATIKVTAVTPYNGPAQMCARVKAVVDASLPFSEIGDGLYLSYLIDGAEAKTFGVDEQSPTRRQANLTRSCNLAEGRHTVTVRVRAGGPSGGILGQFPGDFQVDDNRWPGSITMDYKQCSGVRQARMNLLISTDFNAGDLFRFNDAASGTGNRINLRNGYYFWGFEQENPYAEGIFTQASQQNFGVVGTEDDPTTSYGVQGYVHRVLYVYCQKSTVDQGQAYSLSPITLLADPKVATYYNYRIYPGFSQIYTVQPGQDLQVPISAPNCDSTGTRYSAYLFQTALGTDPARMFLAMNYLGCREAGTGQIGDVAWLGLQTGTLYSNDGGSAYPSWSFKADWPWPEESYSVSPEPPGGYGTIAGEEVAEVKFFLK